MTELRDARLREAMQQAPDGGVRPAARTRDAIHAAAHGAVQPWWLRWRHPAGTRGAWPAAFATVLVAGIITLIWQGQEFPGAVPDGPVAKAPVAAPARGDASPPAVPAVSVAASAAAPPAKPVAPPAPAREAAAPRRSAPADAGTSAANVGEARSAAPSVAGDLARGRSEQAPAAKATDAPLPEKSIQAAPAPEPLRDALAARRAPAAAALAPAPAPPAARAAAAWSQVRVEAGGASIVLERAQAGELVRLLEQLLRAPSEPVFTGGAAALRLELGQGEEAIGVLELSGERWRWLPLGNGQPARTLKPDPALAQELQREAERVLRR